MNEEINWDDAPEGYDLHVKMKTENYLVNHFVKNLDNGHYSLPNGWILNTSLCHQHGIVTERPSQEEEPSLMDKDSLQGQLSHIGNLLHNLSCSMENEAHQDAVGIMASRLWEMSKLLCKQTPEQRLRAKVWDVVAETDIRESEIDAITTDILERFNLEEK
tara:strand:- start:106229 stop:106711 length:483 start_codon:yes stop_codon:yes gene_type:complete